jgi:alpha-glucoside transport system permease protein
MAARRVIADPRVAARGGEVRPLDDHGPPRRSRGRARAGAGLALLVPAALILGVVVARPVVTVVQDSFTGGGARPAGAGHYLDALTDPQLGTDVVNTLSWALVVPVVVTVIGYLLAVFTRDVRASRVLALAFIPMALPLVVTGTAFRILYHPSPRLGPATALAQAVAGWFGAGPDQPQLLGAGLVTPALMSAFLWAWLWLAAVLFRAAIDQIPPGVEDAVRAEGGDSWRVLRDVQWPFLRRTAAVVFMLLAVMASRTFDLVLIMAPGSVQHSAEVLGLYVLRQPTVEASGEAAAVGVVWLLVVGTAVLLGARWVRYDWPAPAATWRRSPPDSWWRRARPGTSRPPGRVRSRRWLLRRVALGAVVAGWAVPLVLLALVSSYDPIEPATRGWLAVPTGSSYQALAGSGVLDTLLPTAGMGVVVSATVVVVAALAAYSLAWLRPYGSAAATGALLLAAIVPIQVIAGPLHDVLAPLRLQGTVLAPVLVHIGRGIPLAVLVLRNAFGAVAADRVARARLDGSTELGVLARVVVPAAWPALAAVAALEFILVWNDLVVGLLFGGSEFTPVAMALFGQSRQFTTSAGVLAAGALVASVPPVLVALLARKAIVAGLISGVSR